MELNKVIHRFVQKCVKEKINFDTIKGKFLSKIDDIDEIIKSIYSSQRVLPIESMSNKIFACSDTMKRCQAEKYNFNRCNCVASFEYNNTYLCWKHSYFLAKN
ncbi:hypothetical protein CPAV1605_523 [seawater metagenome]|uniref:Uncharacterized protein n=1 Tax=seawater metagenome TaxID=1561972 RepID=A0A5E8CHC9_9ZZZZ